MTKCITAILENYIISDGSIIAISCDTGQWDTMLNYDNIPSWATHTCEVYDGLYIEICVTNI